MSKELTVKQDQVLALVQEKDLGELIKPLVKEIHLFDTYIAGVSQIEDASRFQELQPGEALFLQREPSKFDEQSIAVFNNRKQKLGYIPERDEVIFSRLMDAGKHLSAKVLDVTENKAFYKVKISVNMNDY